ncbi:MAG: NADH-quinone oxidoreductase subunit NuoE [bacterium]|jgi:NADH-quinone oxidoreductase E subunit|nr:NADH-quinone oxidoreductase subunit NuoE [bacterium]
MFKIRESCPDKVEDILRRFPQKKSASIPLLYLAWDTYGYVSKEAIQEVAEILGTTPAYIQGIATFYTMFPMEPRGKYHIEVCNNISCFLMGANTILETLEKKLGIQPGECSADGQFSLQAVECLAACSWGPCLHLNGKEYQQLTPEKIDEILDPLMKEAACVK